MTETIETSRNNILEKPEGVFQSIIRFGSGRQYLAASLTLNPSVDDGPLTEKSLFFLHPEEVITGNKFASGIRRRSFLHGRITAKMALNQLFPEVPSANLHIATGCLGEPILHHLSQPYSVSIAHDDIWNAGLCFPLSVPMGVDVESITEKNRAIILSVLSDHEKEMCFRESNTLAMLHLLWTVKEAAGKAIGLGFRVPVDWYMVDSFKTVETEPLPIRQCCFKNLSVFTALSVEIPGGVLSIAFPSEKMFVPSMIRLLQPA